MAECSHLNIPISIGNRPERRWLFLVRFLLSFRQYFVRETFISLECMSKKLGQKDEAEIGTGCPLIVCFSGNEPDLGIRARYGQSSYEFVIYLLPTWFAVKDQNLVTTWSWQTVDAVVEFVHHCGWIHQPISPHIISQLLPNANSEEAIKWKSWRILVGYFRAICRQ